MTKICVDFDNITPDLVYNSIKNGSMNYGEFVLYMSNIITKENELSIKRGLQQASRLIDEYIENKFED